MQRTIGYDGPSLSLTSLARRHYWLETTQPSGLPWDTWLLPEQVEAELAAVEAAGWSVEITPCGGCEACAEDEHE